jgi:hypothetical protein
MTYRKFRLQHCNVIVGHVLAVLSVLGNNFRVACNRVSLRDVEKEIVVFAPPQCLVKAIHRQHTIASEKRGRGYDG